MKRLNNLYGQIYSMDNLLLADAFARRGKSRQKGVKLFDQDKEANLLALQQSLMDKTYQTGEYKTFVIYEPKERMISKLDYIHRIAHHAIMNVLENILTAMFTADTYSCIKGRGIHGAERAIKKALNDTNGTRYCLKMDITKFYPTVDHEILKQIIRRKLKDNDLLWLLDSIIDSAPGLPIGNYLSQYFANLYLTYFDHWLKEVLRVKYYFRYADDMVLLGADKQQLHQLLANIRHYLTTNLSLNIKPNYQVFPVAARGIDFVGYVFYHTHTRLRKTIKVNFAREVAGRNNPDAIAGYMGWVKHCNGRHLVKKVLHHDTI
jgi:RNA-directed DNA polymerase